MKKHLFTRKIPAVGMIEILVGLCVVTIITTTAVVIFMPVISKAKSMEAKSALEFVFTQEKTHFYLNSTYSTSFSEISYEPNKLVTEGGNANYKIEIVEASNKSFKATATAVVDFDADGIFNVWQVDQDKIFKEVTPD